MHRTIMLGSDTAENEATERSDEESFSEDEQYQEDVIVRVKEMEVNICSVLIAKVIPIIFEIPITFLVIFCIW